MTLAAGLRRDSRGTRVGAGRPAGRLPQYRSAGPHPSFSNPKAASVNSLGGKSNLHLT